MLDSYAIDPSLIRYWESHGLTDKDFFCRECGKFMLDVRDITYIKYIDEGKTFQRKFMDGGLCYSENDQNRWLVRGRILSGKTYFRHLCWDCLFKHLGEVEDIPRRARKSSWYKDINNGIFRPPRACQSPSKYFKLIFDITDKELEAEHNKFDTASLESFIRRHGKENGEKLFEEYKNRQAYTCSKEYMMNEKGMTEKEWDEYNQSRACTKKNFIKRYGKELGQKKWKEYCELEAYAGCQLDYFIEKFGEEDGKKAYLELNKKKTSTIDNYIRIYGEEEGKKRFAVACDKQYSNVSKVLFDAISEKMGKFGSDAMYGDHEIPISLYFDDGTCRVCYPDYVLHTKIIEFNGDFWHANPQFYDAEEEMSFANRQLLKYGGSKAHNIWEYDNKKKRKLEDMGYKVKVVWEHDYREDPDKMVNECIEFLKS